MKHKTLIVQEPGILSGGHVHVVPDILLSRRGGYAAVVTKVTLNSGQTPNVIANPIVIP